MRLPEDHLAPDEMISLPESPEDLISEGPSRQPSVQPSTLLHLERCEECMNLAQTYWRLRQLRGNSSADRQRCPSSSAWLELAAGLREERAELMAAHASRCTACALAWQEAVELVGSHPSQTELEISLEESELQLASSTQEWQQRVADRMAAIARSSFAPEPIDARQTFPLPGRRAWRKSFSPSIVWALAGGLAAACGIAAFLLYNSSSAALRRTNHLIAEAYTTRRTLPFRIPGARYSRIQETRGSVPAHGSRPVALLKAETQIAVQLQSRNQDSRWFLASANANLLEGDFDRAVQILYPQANPQSGSSSQAQAEIDTALATAFFERAQQNHTLDDFGNAREFIGRAIDKDPLNPVALFNRALIDEKMGMYGQAINDWQQYLQAEPANEWTAEAHEHLALCQQKKHDKEKATGGESLLSPRELATPASPGTTEADLDQRIEDYQLRILTEDLPALAEEEAASHSSLAPNLAAFERIAATSAQAHHDKMIEDLIASSNLAPSVTSAKQLAAAIVANRAGDEEQALRLARKAAAGFGRIGNTAGSLRAQFEMLYAMQFMSRSTECSTLASTLVSRARQNHYAWLAVAAETEAGFCANMNGDLSAAAQLLHRAAQDASQDHYPAALDRALVGAAALDLQAGSTTKSWEIALAGLNRFWSSSVPYERGESFYDLLEEMAERKQQWHLQSVLLMESLSLIERGQDRLAEAQVLVRLAASQLMLHHSEKARDLLSRALVLFHAAPQTPATLSQELMVRIDLAKAEADSHDYATAVSQLEPLRPQVAQLHEDLSLIEFYTTLGEAYRKLGNQAHAVDCDLAAISIFQTGLSSLNRARDRLTWYRTVSSAYRSLVQLRISQNQTTEALAIWQEYRQSGLPSSPHSSSSHPQVHPSSYTPRPEIEDPQGGPKPPLNQDVPVPPTTLVYANLPDGAFAWAISSHRIHAARLDVPYETITQLGAQFADECSSPSSDINGVVRHGRQLYRILIEPFVDLLPEDGTVLIEPDEELARIPFSALVDTHSRYLNATHTLAIAPFAASPSPSAHTSLASSLAVDPTAHLLTLLPALLVESRFGTAANQAEDSQSSHEIQTVASFFPNSTILGPTPSVQKRFLGLLKHVAIFHYAGHSATSGNGSALALRQRDPSGLERIVSLGSDDLEGTRLDRVRLAVLSACQTDRGQGEHWLDRDNIAVTLLGAGIPEVVATRWDIDSGATTSLMEAFYANVSQGLTVPQSLRYAAEKTRQLPQYQHPYYWAAFSSLERTGAIPSGLGHFGTT